jgi:HEAT repeat protein
VWRILRGLREPAALLPSSEQRSALHPHEIQGLPAWIMALGLDDDQRLEALRPLLHAENSATRLFALRRLIALAEADPGQPLLDVIAQACHDPKAPLARMALNYVLRRDYADRDRLLGELLASPHPSVRAIASRQFAPVGFARLWHSWPQMDRSRRQAAGRALWKIDPDLPRQIEEKLASPDRGVRLRALSMIEELNHGNAFEQTLTRLTQDPDRYVASAATKALGTAGSEQAAASLQQVLDHPDSRVRANAVEALDQLNSNRHLQQLAAMASDEDNRPRANAIKSLMDMETGKAMAALTHMLADDRTEHRNSALWLVETIGLVEVARQVGELAAYDPDPDVRTRATQAARQLLAGSQPRGEPTQPHEQPAQRPARSTG